MRTGVVGCGVVGSAVATMLSDLGHEVARFDPAKGLSDDLCDLVVAFVCIYDYEALDGVLRSLVGKADVIAIKTTCPVGTVDGLIEDYGRNIAYVPEFLDSKTAEYDCSHPDKVVIGTRDVGVYQFLAKLHEPLGAPTICVTPAEAEMIKLAINTFYAIKVTFAEEVKDLCDVCEIDYAAVLSGLYMDRYIAKQHMMVGKDGYRGFGGACLPKDSRLFCYSGYARSHIPKLAQTARDLNDLRRSGHL